MATVLAIRARQSSRLLPRRLLPTTCTSFRLLHSSLSVRGPWAAASVDQDDKFLVQHGYGKFLGDLDQLAKVETDHLTQAALYAEHNKHAFRNYALKGFKHTKPDKKNPLNESVNRDSDFTAMDGWGYIKMTYRLRMLWRLLYRAALDSRQVPNAEGEVEDYNAEYPTYISRFFATHIEGANPNLDALFPPKMRMLLRANQIEIRRAHKRFLETHKEGLKEGKKEWPLVMSSGAWPQVFGNDLKIAVPLGTQDLIRGGQEGAIGPVSLEVAFMLALQIQGIDLNTYVDAVGENPTMSSMPPFLSATKLLRSDDAAVNGDIVLKDDNAMPVGKFQRFEWDVGSNKEQDFHTTVFTAKPVLKDLDKSGTVGLYCGIDMWSKVDDKRPKNAQMFGFIAHVNDFNTVQVKITREGTVDENYYRTYIVDGIRDHIPGGKHPIPAWTLPNGYGAYPTWEQEMIPAPEQDWQSARVVRPHAHPAIWDEAKFDQTFVSNSQSALPDTGSYSQEMASIAGCQKNPFHIYLLPAAYGMPNQL